MKFIATTSDKINSINVVSGQVIFSTDDRVIYLDSNIRNAFSTIITLATEAQRLGIIPVKGFYFVEETSILWRYGDSGWEQLTGEGDSRIIFANREDFPAVGQEHVLYCTPDAIYQYSNTTHSYVQISGSQSWESII